LNISNYISKYREKLKKNIFFQNIAVVAGGNVAAKLTGIVTTPIITRLYTPADYGIFTIFMSVIGIAGSLSTLRYAVTIPIATNEKVADNLLRLSFIITFSLSLFMVIVFALFGNFILDEFSIQKLGVYLWFIPVVFLGQGLYQALNNWAVRVKKFKLITRTVISQSVTGATIKIGLGALNFTPIGLFYGQVAMVYAGIGSLFLKLKKEKPHLFNGFSWEEIKFAVIRYKDFPLIQSWSQLLLVLGAQLPVLLIGAFYGAKVVGVFGLAIGMIALPMTMLGQAVSQVYYAEISRYGKNEPEKIYRLSVSIIKKMFWIGIIPVAILIITGPQLFGFVFGAQWYEAGIFAQILSPLILFRFISSPIMNVLNVLEKQGLQLILNLLRLIMIILIFYLSNYSNFSAKGSLILYSICLSIFYLLVVLKIIRLIKIKSVK
jgi:O-antigen/teichoic acid export membrane protein